MTQYFAIYRLSQLSILKSLLNFELEVSTLIFNDKANFQDGELSVIPEIGTNTNRCFKCSTLYIGAYLDSLLKFNVTLLNVVRI